MLKPPSAAGDECAEWSLVAATPGHPLLTTIERYRGGPFADLAEPQTLVQAVRALLDMADEHPAPGVLLCHAEQG